jgi:hypothetical protein
VHILASGRSWGSRSLFFLDTIGGLFNYCFIDHVNLFYIPIGFSLRSQERIGEASIALDFVINSVPTFVLPVREEKDLRFRFKGVHILRLFLI